MKTYRAKLLKATRLNGKHVKAGTVVNLPSMYMVKCGKAELVKGGEKKEGTNAQKER